MSQVDLEDMKQVGSSRVSVAKSNASATVHEPSRPQTAKKSEEGANVTSVNSSTPPSFPEGGFTAWATVFGAFLIQVCNFGYTTSFGVYQDYYKRVYLTNESSSAISWIGSINSFLVIALGIYVGRLYDRGYFYHLLYGGSILLSFGLFMHSLAKPDAYYQILLSQGIAVGLGGGMLYIPSIAVVSQYFHKRRALAMTLVASGSSAGAVIHPIVLNNTLNDPSIGFATAARISAGLVSVLLLIACLIMRTRTDPPKSNVNLWTAARKIVKDGPFVAAACGMSVFIIALYFPLFYIQLDALTHGLDKTFSFYALVIMNGCSFVGRIAPGFVANRLGIYNIIIVSTFSATVLIFSMIALKTVASVVVICIIYGFFAGVYITLLGPLLALLTDDMSELGARMGIAFCMAGIGSLIGTPIDGALLTSDNIWWRPALFSGLVGICGFCCFCTSLFLLRHRKHREMSSQ